MIYLDEIRQHSRRQQMSTRKLMVVAFIVGVVIGLLILAVVLGAH